VADPDQAFGGQSNSGRQKVFTCLNTKGCLRQSPGVTQKLFVGQKVAIFAGRTMLFFRE